MGKKNCYHQQLSCNYKEMYLQKLSNMHQVDIKLNFCIKKKSSNQHKVEENFMYTKLG